jgi:hypothetical protein
MGLLRNSQQAISDIVWGWFLDALFRPQAISALPARSDSLHRASLTGRALTTQAGG